MCIRYLRGTPVPSRMPWAKRPRGIMHDALAAGEKWSRWFTFGRARGESETRSHNSNWRRRFGSSRVLSRSCVSDAVACILETFFVARFFVEAVLSASAIHPPLCAAKKPRTPAVYKLVEYSGSFNFTLCLTSACGMSFHAVRKVRLCTTDSEHSRSETVLSLRTSHVRGDGDGVVRSLASSTGEDGRSDHKHGSRPDLCAAPPATVQVSCKCREPVGTCYTVVRTSSSPTAATQSCHCYCPRPPAKCMGDPGEGGVAAARLGSSFIAQWPEQRRE